MKTKLTRSIGIFLTLIMLFSISTCAVDLNRMSDSLAGWLKKNITVAQAGDSIDSYLDWTVFAMARNGYTDYNEDYKAYIGEAVSKNQSSLFLNDYARIALAVMAVGMDASDVGGKNLIEAIEKSDYKSEAYTGSVAYALIALDAAKSGNETARDSLKAILVDAQREDGGFNSYIAADETAYWTASGETDSTGIALQALAPYKDENAVKNAIEKAVSFVENEQMDDGGFGSFGAGSAESTSMILCGLCAVGENPDLFVKNGKTIIDSLAEYINEDGGARCYDGTSNIMTSYQVLMGLSAYERYKDNTVGLFDMSCLSPKCSSIEHNAFFEKFPVLGKILCKIVAAFCNIFGIEYYCCRH